MKTRAIVGLAIAIGLAGLGSHAAAESMTWVGSISEDWFDATNWSLGLSPLSSYELSVADPGATTMPQTATDVTTEGGGSITVDGAGCSATFERLEIGGTAGTGTLNVLGAAEASTVDCRIGSDSEESLARVAGLGSTLTATFQLAIGSGGLGRLDIEDGGEVISDWVSVGSGGSGEGAATVDNAAWTNSGEIHVGFAGSGTLSVQNGATVLSPYMSVALGAGSIGTVTVDDASLSVSSQLYIGHCGSATMEVRGGGTLATGAVDIAVIGQSNAEVTIDGAGSTWNATAIVVGGCGDAQLDIQNAAQWTTGTVYLGAEDGGSGDVTVDAAGWTCTDTLYVGGSDETAAAGSGTLTLQNAGTFAGTVGYVGYAEGSSGSLSVQGGSSNWTSTGTLYVGYRGSATVLIQNGGSVSVGALDLAALGNATADVTIDGPGSTCMSGGNVRIGGYGRAVVSVRNGAQWTTGSACIGHGPSVEGGLVTVDAATWTNTAALYVGGDEDGAAGLGALTIQNGGTLGTASGYLGRNAGSSGAVTITAAGSTGNHSDWTNSGSLQVGGLGTGALNILAGGRLTTTDLVIGSLGTVNLSGGTLALVTLSGETALNFTAGTLDITSNDLTIAEGRPLGDSLVLNDQQVLGVEGTLTVAPRASLTVDGGEVSAGSLVNDAELVVRASACVSTVSGLLNGATMELAGATIEGGRLTNDFSGTVSADGTVDAELDNYGDLTLTGVLYVHGRANNYGSIHIGATRTLRQDEPMENYGTIKLDGGAITGVPGGSGSLVNRSGGVIRGDGGVSLPLTNAGGLILAEGTATLLISDFSGGNSTGGEMRIEPASTVNVLSAFANAGLIFLGGADASLSGGSISNGGRIHGEGHISNPVTNCPGGIIEVDQGTLLVTQGVAENQGTIVLHGGTFDNGSNPLENSGYITGHGTFRGGGLTNTGHVGVGSGDMDVIGPVGNHGSFDVQAGCAVTFYGPVNGSGDFPWPGDVTFLAGYGLGDTPEEIRFGGDLVLGSATALAMKLGGMAAGLEHDLISVAGHLALGGELEIVLINAFVPEADDTFNLFDFGTLAGTFETVDLPDLSGGLSWDASELYTTGEIVVLFTPIPGDANLDDQVDDMDASILAGHWQMSSGAAWADGDFNGDGKVNDADASILAVHWQEGAGEAAAAVPEPSTLALLVVGAVCALILRSNGTRHSTTEIQ